MNAKPFKGVAHKAVDFILEGGSVESDGLNTIQTTKQCLLIPNTNKGLTQQEIEQQLLQHLSVKPVLWLDQENLSGDDTDDLHYTGLKYMERQLQSVE